MIQALIAIGTVFAIDVIGYIIRTKCDKDFAVCKVRLYPFMWIFYQNN